MPRGKCRFCNHIFSANNFAKLMEEAIQHRKEKHPKKHEEIDKNPDKLNRILNELGVSKNKEG
jgi:hypothetical protein